MGTEPDSDDNAHGFGIVSDVSVCCREDPDPPEEGQAPCFITRFDVEDRDDTYPVSLLCVVDHIRPALSERSYRPAVCGIPASHALPGSYSHLNGSRVDRQRRDPPSSRFKNNLHQETPEVCYFFVLVCGLTSRARIRNSEKSPAA